MTQPAPTAEKAYLQPPPSKLVEEAPAWLERGIESVRFVPFVQ